MSSGSGEVASGVGAAGASKESHHDEGDTIYQNVFHCIRPEMRMSVEACHWLHFCAYKQMGGGGGVRM